MAVGLEYSHMWFDGASASPLVVNMAPGHDAWQTDTISLLAEHQWHLNDKWTTFASARGDKHTYTKWLVSPRLALSFAPAPRNAQVDRRTRHAPQRRRRVAAGACADRRAGIDGNVRQPRIPLRTATGQIWNFGISVFHERNAAIGFSSVLNHSIPVGTFRIWGVEPEISFRSETTRLTLSHATPSCWF